MRSRRFSIGKFIYLEWLKPISDYYFTLQLKYAIYELIIPIAVGIVCTVIYYNAGKVDIALDALSELLPTAISILIGFTTMLITLLLTSSGENIERIKDISTDMRLNNEYISLYQSLHIHFSHSLFSEILFLLLIFFQLFLKGLNVPAWIPIVFLGIFVFYILNILFAILRGIANIYFCFYKNNS